MSTLTRITVLHRDEHWLVLDKPPGMATTAPAPEGLGVLVDAARRICPKARHHHPLSRLDVEVSGAVAFALTDVALARAEQGRSLGRYARHYQGLAGGTLAQDQGVWTLPIGVDPRNPRRRTTGPRARDPKDAETRFEVLRWAPGALWLDLRPRTGRTHQLRVHAAAAGVPLLGDGAYGGARMWVGADGAVTEVPRVMLHLAWVALDDSFDRVESPLPEDFRALWRACGGHEESR